MCEKYFLKKEIMSNLLIPSFSSGPPSKSVVISLGGKNAQLILSVRPNLLEKTAEKDNCNNCPRIKRLSKNTVI